MPDAGKLLRGTIKELHAMRVSKGAEARAPSTMPSIISPASVHSNQPSCTAQGCGWGKLGIKRYDGSFIGSALAF